MGRSLNIIAFIAFLLPGFSAHASDTMHVLLQEWRIVADKTQVKAGQVTFDVQNRGRETHEIVLLRTDLPHDRLPLMTKGGINEALAGEVIDEIEDVGAFARHQITTFLKPGNYVLLCNMVEMEEGELEQHYAMGMRIPIVVQ